MADFELFKRILSGGMRYEFDGSVLTLTGYWSGESVSVDLSQLTAEAFSDIVVETETED